MSVGLDAETHGSDLAVAIDRAIGVLLSFSIPLYVSLHGRPVQIGTGFFVRASKQSFLVSAAHVLDAAPQPGLFFYSSPGTVRHLSGKLVLSPGRYQRREDRIDIGVLKLSGEFAPPYQEVNKFPIDSSYLKPGRTPRFGKRYAVVGFPSSRSRLSVSDQTVIAAPYAYYSQSIDDALYSTIGLDPRAHIILPLNLKRSFDLHGSHTHFPKPQGMSGSPIVELFDESGANDSRVFPVVGVGIEYRLRQKVLIGTDIGFVLRLIENAA